MLNIGSQESRPRWRIRSSIWLLVTVLGSLVYSGDIVLAVTSVPGKLDWNSLSSRRALGMM